jgi:hypothetical protein
MIFCVFFTEPSNKISRVPVIILENEEKTQRLLLLVRNLSGFVHLFPSCSSTLTLQQKIELKTG